MKRSRPPLIWCNVTMVCGLCRAAVTATTNGRGRYSGTSHAVITSNRQPVHAVCGRHLQVVDHQEVA